MKNEKIITPKRFIMNMTEELHHSVKIRATLRNISMRNYIIQAIAEKIIKEDLVNQ